MDVLTDPLPRPAVSINVDYAIAECPDGLSKFSHGHQLVQPRPAVPGRREGQRLLVDHKPVIVGLGT